MDANQLKRLKELERGVSRLKKIAAEPTYGQQLYKDVIEKMLQGLLIKLLSEI